MDVMRGDKSPTNTSREFHTCGIWTLASYTNHSCYSNASRSFIGDMMVVRASQDLAPNTELTFWYHPPFDNSKGKPMDLHPAASIIPRLSIWEPYLALANLYAMYGQPKQVIEAALAALESPGYIVEGGRLPHAPGTPLIVKKWGLMTESLIGCWMVLSRAYREVAPDLEAYAEGYAMTSYRIYVGEDEPFDETYSKRSERPGGFLAGAK